MNIPIQDNLFLPFNIPGMGGLPCVPSHFTWESVASDEPALFYTDFCMRNALNHPRPRIGWLVEAPPYAQCHYDWAVEHEDEFDVILTYVKEYVDRGEPWLWYPHGGSHVPLDQWKLHPKKKLVSLLASFKTETEGHILRHEIAQRFGDRVDVLGSINGTHVDKLDGIAPYYYSIVVAAERNDYCFSDHIIDCFALGTVPIYWGCPSLINFFDPGGFITFRTLNDLEPVLDRISIRDFYTRFDAGVVRDNLETARQYRVPEDWIYEHYPSLFEV